MVTKGKQQDADGVTAITITELKTSAIRVKIIGTSPLILNAMSQKVWQELLAPRKKTAADRANNLKHRPLEEFRACPYYFDNPKAPTLLGFMASGFKKAMQTAALRIPGVKKTEVSQLIYVSGNLINVYGIPKVFMAITRSADMARTPDTRTRAILPEWAVELELRFVTPALTETAILNLLQAAGFVSGVGDWRQEKGSGSFGSFELVTADNEDEFNRIVKTGGRAAQQAAMDNPVAYNSETARMLTWFDEEIKRRGTEKSTAAAAGDGTPAKRGPKGKAKPGANGHDAAPMQ